MTIYVHNPPEPHANPTQPIPDLRGEHKSAFDLYTQGLCGNCAACPKVWRMEVPLLPSPYAQDYAGTYYLHRQSYLRQNRFQGQCCWTTGDLTTPRIPGENRYQGPHGDGWQLVFQLDPLTSAGFGWYLYSPTEGSFPADTTFSVWRRGTLTWQCLKPNTLQYFVGEFPYSPDFLTLTPFYA